LTREYHEVPLYTDLFSKFYTFHILKDIHIKTNRHASSLDENGSPISREGWYSVTENELRIFMACTLYMGMKKLHNIRQSQRRSFIVTLLLVYLQGSVSWL
jgi:hypothetical protein